MAELKSKKSLCPKEIYSKLLLRFFKKKIVKGYSGFCKGCAGKALLYYKTDPFVSSFFINSYMHTNNWEIFEIVKILNTLGFVVDILDRDISLNDLKNLDSGYDIFIGLGAGNSGKYFPEIASRLKRAIKILYAAGPEPILSNKLILKRYDYFYKRHKQRLKLRRMIDKLDFPKAIAQADVIFAIGNDFSLKSYKKYKKPIYRILPSSSPNISFSLQELKLKNKKSFLFFGGNGAVVKGLDLVIESFAKLPKLKLYICSPFERDFFGFYASTLAKAKNIHYLGFVKPGSKIFNKLTQETSFIVLPSCSEGIATSVTTCMRRALIPVVTYEAGIDIADFGVQIEELSIDALAKLFDRISNYDDKELKKRIIKSYMASFDYTQESFRRSFTKAILSVLNEFNLIK